MTPTARAVALEALLAGGTAAEQLDRQLRGADLRPADRAFATELAYGTLKMRRSLEWSVAQCLTRPIAQVQARLRWILLLGAYQILFLDRVPAHSAVDEAVKLARAGGNKGTAGFVNAVLRNVAQVRPAPPPPSRAGGAPSLGLYASLPDWIAAHLIDRFGFDTAIRAAQGMNGPPRRALRIDLRTRSRDDFLSQLAANGVRARAGRYDIPECVVVADVGDGRGVRAAIEMNGAAWQSEESQLAVHLLDPRPGEIILDACAGRGVKTAMIAHRLAGGGAVWSIDDDETKLAALARAQEKNGVVRAVRADARAAYPDTLPASVDAALVDAPCSGLGVLGRRPDARWRKRETDPARFATVQAAILRRAADRIRRGGRLLYVTCTTQRTEDEGVVEAFLAERADWRALPVSPSLTVPGIDGADGFFYALLTRVPGGGRP